MNRREFARNVVGAIFGVSVIPEFGKKPQLKIPPVTEGKNFLKVNFTNANQLWIYA